MKHPLTNHQSVDAIGREVFHVAVKQARSLSIQHSVAVPDNRANRRASSFKCEAAYAPWRNSQIRISISFFPASRSLVWERKPADCNFVLIRVSSPGAIHQAVSFVFLIFRKNFKRAFVERSIHAARIERCHSPNCQHSTFMTDLDEQVPEILKERHIVWDRVAIREH